MAKIRAIVNGVSFYTTSTAIKQRRVGDSALLNSALEIMLEMKGKYPSVGRNIAVYDDKMKRHSFDIQLDVV